VGLEDLFAQLASFIGVAHDILHANFLHVVRTEVIPVDIGDVEEACALLAGC